MSTVAKPTVIATKVLHASATVPKQMTEGAAGADLAACLETPVSLQPGCAEAISTGIALAIPPGYEGQVRPRSGLAFRHQVTVLNAPGTIDADYRGELKVLLINHGAAPFVVEHGMRIAQLVVARVAACVFVEQAELGETARDAGGFGHTGL